MRRAFTLIELLVVIAIIAILAAILFPVFAQAKQTAKNSVSVSNMKQIGLAGQMYMADYDDQHPQGDEYAEWIWMFLYAPYIKGAPTDFSKPKSSFFYSPTAPGTLPQYLSERRYDYMVQSGMAASFGLRTDLFDPEGIRAIVFWCSYSINEHVVQEWPNGSAYADPANTFWVIEAIDTEIEGDEIRKLFARTADCSGGNPSLFEERPTMGGHAGGTNYLWIDAHVKWKKTTYAPTPGTAVGNNVQCNFRDWVFPQGGRGGASTTPNGSGVRPDCGEWTAPDDIFDAGNVCVGK